VHPHKPTNQMLIMYFLCAVQIIDAGDRKLNMLKFLRELVKGWQQIRWGLLAISDAIIFAGIGLAVTRKVSGKVDKITLIQ